MVAALGSDAATNCAAARAGLRRARVLENFPMRSAVDGTEEFVMGHEATLQTRGFEGDMRLVRLSQGALSGLLLDTQQINWHEQEHQFYLALPDSARTLLGAEPADGEEEVDAGGAAVAGHSTDAARRVASEKQARVILTRAAALARWPVEPTVAFLSTHGHAAGLDAIRAASLDLAVGRVEVAVVLAVDSLLDQETLNWLHQNNRLKCDGMPVGLQPGEAGVAVTLTMRSGLIHASAQGVTLGEVWLDAEPLSLLSGAATRGETLARVVEQAWRSSNAERPWILSDQNGEEFRAMEWGHALVRLRGQSVAFSAPEAWYAASSFGDTAAASALVNLCMAVRSWERRYAPAAAALITAASDGIQRGALMVSDQTSARRA
jgi:hypothetical protein